jgi:dTDP-3-amino-3,4,6-trideoxy-alpha-D-glucose transaminase
LTVPFLDVAAATRELRPRLDAAIARVLERGWFILGDELAAFERGFAAACGARECVGVASGLDALHLLLRARGIGAGADVLVPSNTFIATWLAVDQAGATPVPVEPDPATHLVTAASVAAAWTPRARAVLAVHLYGQPCDVEAISAVARERGGIALFDAAQAHGAALAGRPAGAGCDSAWSFYPGKNLGALGDGGAVTTDDPALAAELRLLRNYGSRVRYQHEQKGWNSRLDELQAALLAEKLPLLDEWNRRRARVAGRYLAELRGVTLPVVGHEVRPSWHLFVVRSPRRDALRAHLAARGVETLIHYPTPPHQQAAYGGRAFPPLPVADRLASEVLSLPIGPHLSDRQADEVIAAVNGF